MTTFNSPIGPAIRRHRERRHLKVADLADLTGTGANRVYDWERGVHTPTLPVLKRLADALNTTVSELVAGL